jgi:hypothetical protein
MAAGPTYPDTWGTTPRIDLDEELAEHDTGRHDTDPQPGTCPSC